MRYNTAHLLTVGPATFKTAPNQVFVDCRIAAGQRRLDAPEYTINVFNGDLSNMNIRVD